jgi:hypothetical protein
MTLNQRLHGALSSSKHIDWPVSQYPFISYRHYPVDNLEEIVMV